jgi:AcrR family transcriptional regulator
LRLREILNVPAKLNGYKSAGKLTGKARGCSTQGARTAMTCRKLLGAAERIFARDGFEAARLEDIAAGAGYTRGAFYANFKSKEDIFYALLEEWVKERTETITKVLDQHEDPHDKLSALREYYVENAKNRRLVLISLEFKLFALRHPEAHARLRDRHRHLRAAWSNLLSKVLEALDQTPPVTGAIAATCLAGVAHGLLIEHLVDPKSLPESSVREVLGLFVDSIFSAGVNTSSSRISEKLVTKAQ